MIRYFSKISNGKLILWCYLIWWGNTLVYHFDPSLNIWLNSLGISFVVGMALILSVGGFSLAIQNKWQTFRLFAMPFCVSSFSSLIKDKQFILIFPPSVVEILSAAGICLLFVTLVMLLRRFYKGKV